MGCFKVIVSLTKVSKLSLDVTTGRNDSISAWATLKRREGPGKTSSEVCLGFDSLRVHSLFSSLDPDHYLCWFLQVLESQVLHDEIMYVLCHLRVLEPPVFASLHRV